MPHCYSILCSRDSAVRSFRVSAASYCVIVYTLCRDTISWDTCQRPVTTLPPYYSGCLTTTATTTATTTTTIMATTTTPTLTRTILIHGPALGRYDGLVKVSPSKHFQGTSQAPTQPYMMPTPRAGEKAGHQQGYPTKLQQSR